MEILKLKAQPRTGRGKSYTRKIRTQGLIPGIYYGHHDAPLPITVDAREFTSIVRAGKTNRLIELAIDGSQDKPTTIIKEIQRHVLKDTLFYNIDFQHVAMDKNITVQVAIHLTGIPIGVRDEGGILGQQLRTLSIECLPKDIPDFVSVDVSELHIGSAIHVSDVKVENVTIKDSPEEVVAVVVHPQTVVEEKPQAAEGGEEGAVPEEGGEAAAEKESSKDKEKESK